MREARTKLIECQMVENDPENWTKIKKHEKSSGSLKWIDEAKWNGEKKNSFLNVKWNSK